MKFNSHLTEAVLLKRTMRFMAQVVLGNRQKIMLRCPNIGNMQGADILGSKIWYSNAIGYHCLPTWEIVEVDEGHLVCVNPELMKPLIVEAIKANIISELENYTILHTGGHFDQFRSQFLLLEKNQQQCYVGLEHVIIGNNQGEGLFPGGMGDGRDNLEALLQAKESGNRAILIFCVTHQGVEQIKIASHIDNEYQRLIRAAMDAGVEIVAYKANMSTHNIELNQKIEVILPETILR